MYKTVVVNHHKREIWIAKNSYGNYVISYRYSKYIYYKMQYVWYTKREAIKEFKKYLSEKLKKWEG